MSSWNGQLCGKEGYFLQFETKDYETYRRVEKLCQSIMDEENAKREAEKKSILNYEIDKITGIDYTIVSDDETLTEYKENEIYLEEDKIIDTTFIPEPCRGCSNHPSNGGSGICNCTLGQFKIT